MKTLKVKKYQQKLMGENIQTKTGDMLNRKEIGGRN